MIWIWISSSYQSLDFAYFTQTYMRNVRSAVADVTGNVREADELRLTLFYCSIMSQIVLRSAWLILTRAYVKRRGPRRKGVKYGCNSL